MTKLVACSWSRRTAGRRGKGRRSASGEPSAPRSPSGRRPPPCFKKRNGSRNKKGPHRRRRRAGLAREREGFPLCFVTSPHHRGVIHPVRTAPAAAHRDDEDHEEHRPQQRPEPPVGDEIRGLGRGGGL